MSENSVAKGIFLECLEPYILSDKLMGITAQVMKDLLLHFQDKNRLENLEACIVHMDITSLDIQQVSGCVAYCIELLWINQQLQHLVLLSTAWHVGFPCVPGIKFSELDIVQCGCVLLSQLLSWHRLMHQQLNVLENPSGFFPITLPHFEYLTWHQRLQEHRKLELFVSLGTCLCTTVSAAGKCSCSAFLFSDGMAFHFKGEAAWKLDAMIH